MNDSPIFRKFTLRRGGKDGEGGVKGREEGGYGRKEGGEGRV